MLVLIILNVSFPWMVQIARSINHNHSIQNGIHTSSKGLVCDMKLEFVLQRVISFGSMEETPCGEWPELRIAKDELIYFLKPGEKVVVDGSYNRQLFFITPTGVIRARHETVNRRFKQFNVLANRFRHNIEKHSDCFYAVANVTQISIQEKSPLFSVHNDE